ncbi:hypothetical protein BCR36DRAFT_324955 [Piromyces finnis]|uniref:Coth-domain-containing protein n=1 Tax=Piromyces finnis TaxID=1754191 RepID=A0A1Y1VDQ2_9FUNG|nr:hypothetical protein BCR36DRAFT_324955 [Piromyces finnis]|eukprot:ORX52183.1 hypothetical protein BCR36DRAFT_324955 [Piromyces finnis]
MNWKSAIFTLGLIAKAFSAEFSVVSFAGNCEVNIGGTSYPMKKPDSNVPLWKANIDASNNTVYKYICDGQADVERTLNGNKTYNELIGRPITIFDMPEFGYPNAEPWSRSIGRTELFDPNYVPIVVIDAKRSIFVNGSGGTFNTISFILKENVFTFNNISSSAKNQEEDKFQFEVNLPGEGIYHRTNLKFRPSSFDPAFIRQILYGDIAHAIGNPTHESVSVRVYLSDGTPIGLYVLQENIASESFIRTSFYGNSDGSVKNDSPGLQYLYDCGTGADFTAKDGKYLGSFMNLVEPDLKIELLAMTERLETLDINNAAAVDDFDKNDLDLDTLFRALALEYLAGHWDSYWGLTTNFGVYHPNDDSGNFKFYFIDQDFDQTWGIGMGEGYDPQNYPNKFYTDFVGVENWREISKNSLDTTTRIIVNRLIGCDGANSCITKTMFEAHLQSIVQHIFNPVAMGRKVEGYKSRLRDEIVWDTTIEKLHTGTKGEYHFTINDFENNIDTANYEGSKFYWGILDWTENICNTVCNNFHITYDKVAYTPETAAQAKVNPIDAGTTYDPKSNLKTSDASTIKVNAFIMVIAACFLALLG